MSKTKLLLTTYSINPLIPIDHKNTTLKDMLVRNLENNTLHLLHNVKNGDKVILRGDNEVSLFQCRNFFNMVNEEKETSISYGYTDHTHYLYLNKSYKDKIEIDENKIKFIINNGTKRVPDLEEIELVFKYPYFTTVEFKGERLMFFK